MLHGCPIRPKSITLQQLVIDSFEREEYLLFSAIDEDGSSLDQETCEKLFRYAGSVCCEDGIAANVEDRLVREAERHAQATIARSLECNNQYFLQERERLERWADDMVESAEKELADTKAQIKATNRQARLATTLQEQHSWQEKIRELEKQMRRQRQLIFDVEDEIIAKRDGLIAGLEKRLSQQTTLQSLFIVKWILD